MTRIFTARQVVFVVLMAALTLVGHAQQQGGGTPPSAIASRMATMQQPLAAAAVAETPVVIPSAWRIAGPLGLREPAVVDTAYQNYGRRFIPSEVTEAWATTGNLGAPGIDMIWTGRQPISEFFLHDAFSHWRPTLASMRFYNTPMPMTLLSYNTAGGRDNSQERLQTTFSGNINKRAQVGALLDYLYSKGCYEKQATKELSWGFSGSYLGEHYQMQAFYNHWNQLAKESGGITDLLWITDPAEMQAGVATVDPKSIPTRLSSAHTRLVGQQLYVDQRYNLGYNRAIEGATAVDSTGALPAEFVAAAAVSWTFQYDRSRHVFTDPSVVETSKFFENTYLNTKGTEDITRYQSVTNTVGLSLLEGFHRYARAGLAAYAMHQWRQYRQTPDTLRTQPGFEGLDPLPEGVDRMASTVSQQLLWIGGRLSKQQGSVIRYQADARIGVLGPVAGKIDLSGHLDARLHLPFDTVTVTGHARLATEEAPLLMEQYRSNHFAWFNDFGERRTVTFGGSISSARTGTTISISASNLQNHIYFGEDFMPHQHGGSVQVISARLDQKLKLGILHWDNTVTWQTSSDDAIIALPKLAVRSNLYVMARIATLYLQFGADCDYYTSYYGPAYQPALATFANQRQVKVGNYPWIDIYANMKLSKVRFYVMFSHVNQGIIGGNNYFAVPYYPLNPRRFQLGLSIDFAN